MAADSRPQARKRSRFRALALGLVFFVVFLAFVPNPVADWAVSSFSRAFFGLPVVFHQVRFQSLLSASFRKAELGASPGLARPVTAYSGRVVWRPGQGETYFFAERIDLSALCGGPNSPASGFVRLHGLGDWPLLRDSRWVLTRQDKALFVRLLDSRLGESSVKGGVRLEDGRLSRAYAALWLAGDIRERFPNLVEKRFAKDAKGRRLFKLTWSRGLWRLWGRSAPVLEASWR